jgi:Lrp/AsnC family transcriptional regulator, leucine-responsive regulatory protein
MGESIATKPAADITDHRILATLQRDARLSVRELGRRVALSAPAVGRRLRRLEKEGAIRSYAAEVDPAALGFALTAFVMVTTRSAYAGGRLREGVQEMSQVIECHRLTGERSYLLRVVATSAENLEELVDALAVYGHPTTSIVLSSPISRRPIEPPEP